MNNSKIPDFVHYAILILVCGAITLSTSGCGSVFGVKEFDLWGAKMSFSQGATIRAGINQIDTVDDSQGVNSRKGSYSKNSNGGN